MEEGTSEKIKTGKNWEIIDHTADIGIHATAPDLPGCFEAAAEGMFHIISDGSPIEPVTSFLVELDTDSCETALTDFLSELLYLYETQGILFSGFKVELQRSATGINSVFKENGSEVDVPSIKVRAVCRGEPFDETRHNYPVEIKAVTHHMLEAREGPPASVSVLFDI